MFIVGFVCAVIVRRWHVYRHIRQFMCPVVAAAVVYYIHFAGIPHGMLFGTIAAELDALSAVLQPWAASLQSELAALVAKTALPVTLPVVVMADLAGIAKDVLVILGVLHAFQLSCCAYDWAREMAGLGWTGFVMHMQDMGFEAIKPLWFVQDILNAEKAKFRSSIEEDIKRKARAIGNDADSAVKKAGRAGSSRKGQSLAALPEQAYSHEEVMSLLEECTSVEDVKWEEGKVSGGIYNGDRKHIAFLNRAFNMYSVANPLHLDIWPSAMRFETEIIAMTASMVNGGDEGVVGCTTSGGTESIILAIKAHRDHYRAHHGITSPEMIACVSAHAAVDKACELLKIKLIKVPMDPKTYAIDVPSVTASITSNTIMIYSSAPSFPQGVIDPISTLGKIATYYNIGLHVDCCLGGFVLPFAKRLGYDIPDFDFGVKGVTTMSVDTHKYGYALKGTSVCLYRNAKLRASQYFCYSEWPGGFYTTATLAGSRSCGLLVQTWASLVTVGDEGFMKYTRGIMEAARNIAARITAEIPELRVIGGTKAMIVCFDGNPDCHIVDGHTGGVNVHNVGDQMSKRGWSLNSLQRPASVHLCCTVKHIHIADTFLAELKESVAAVVGEMKAAAAAGKSAKLHGNAAMYGLASSFPAGPVKELLTEYNDNVLGKL